MAGSPLGALSAATSLPRHGKYHDADAIFEDWNQVIRTRDENMEKARRDCPMQKEISRRELLRRLKPV